MKKQAVRIIYSTSSVLFSNKESIKKIYQILCLSNHAPLNTSVLEHRTSMQGWEDWLRAETARLCNKLFAEWSTSSNNPRWLREANQNTENTQVSWKQTLIEIELRSNLDPEKAKDTEDQISKNTNVAENEKFGIKKEIQTNKVNIKNEIFLCNAVHYWFLFEQTIFSEENEFFREVRCNFIETPKKMLNSIYKAVQQAKDANIWSLLKQYIAQLYRWRIKDLERPDIMDKTRYVDAYTKKDDGMYIYENTLKHAFDPREDCKQHGIPYQEGERSWIVAAVDLLGELGLSSLVSERMLSEYCSRSKFLDNEDNTARNGFFSNCFDRTFFSKQDFNRFWKNFSDTKKNELSHTEKRKRITPVLRILWDNELYPNRIEPFLKHLEIYFTLQIKEIDDLIKRVHIQKNIEAAVSVLCSDTNWTSTKTFWEGLEAIPKKQANDRLGWWIQRELTEPFVDALIHYTKNLAREVKKHEREKLHTLFKRAGGNAQDMLASLPELIQALMADPNQMALSLHKPHNNTEP